MGQAQGAPLSLPVSSIKVDLLVLSYSMRGSERALPAGHMLQLSAAAVYVCLHVFNMHKVQGSACGSQKAASECLEWELQVVMSCHVGAGN